jgi:outer membrane receptor protein involved in Fe transport
LKDQCNFLEELFIRMIKSCADKKVVFIAFVLLAGGLPCFAEQDNNAVGPRDLFNMPLEDLMEVSLVSSASRQPQKTGQLTVPVTVITAEDIHYSGLTSVADILQFAPGVDVLRIERDRYAVGIHGLHGTLSDRTTLLIDGRPADNPAYGGPDFQGLPVMIEDIERIEIIRSPASASWGANAINGIINIVTKKPQDVQGTFGSTTVSGFGDSYTHLRVAQKQDNWSWRASGGYQNTVSSDDAINGSANYMTLRPELSPLIGFDNFHANDFARITRFDSEADYADSGPTKFRTGLGYSHLESGNYEYGGYFPAKDIREDHIRSFTRLEHQFDDGTSAHFQWAGKFWNANWPSLSHYNTAENQFETQFNLPIAENHLLSVGGDFKWDHIAVSRDTPQQGYAEDSPFDEYTTGVFAIDRLQLTDRLTLEGQFRIERYTGTGYDWAGRLSALYALDEKHNHIIRFSTAKAYRAPLVIIRKFSTNLFEVSPGFFLYNVSPPDDLKNEEITSIEAGYWGKLNDKFTIEADTYYQRFENIIGYGYTVNAFGQTFVVADNIAGADAYGADLQLTYKEKYGSLSLWYSYNHFKYDIYAQDFKAFLPSRQKAGLTGRLFLSDGWVANAQYRITDITPANPDNGTDVPSSHRLDLAISKSFDKDKCEIMAGVQDVLNTTHAPIIESTQFTGHETPGRTFFVRIQFAF